MGRKIFVMILVMLFTLSTFALAEEVSAPTEEPVLVEEPGDDAQVPVEDPAVEPIEDVVEEPTEEPVEEPVEYSLDKLLLDLAELGLDEGALAQVEAALAEFDLGDKLGEKTEVLKNIIVETVNAGAKPQELANLTSAVAENLARGVDGDTLKVAIQTGVEVKVSFSFLIQALDQLPAGEEGGNLTGEFLTTADGVLQGTIAGEKMEQAFEKLWDLNPEDAEAVLAQVEAIADQVGGKINKPTFARLVDALSAGEDPALVGEDILKELEQNGGKISQLGKEKRGEKEKKVREEGKERTMEKTGDKQKDKVREEIRQELQERLEEKMTNKPGKDEKAGPPAGENPGKGQGKTK